MTPPIPCSRRLNAVAARALVLLGLAGLTACAPAAPELAERRLPMDTVALPAMKTFADSRANPPTRSNASIAADILDLAFQLESGRTLPVLTRFEGPVTIRLIGPQSPGLMGDLDLLIMRLRREAGLDITRVGADRPAGITIQTVPRAELQRAVPQAACFVVPRLTGWDDFKRNRRSSLVDWTTLETRERMAVFIPSDVSPQEMRDCLHEEIAQALGPLNDLYSLRDSVFNDDNFHTVLTGFDMLVLRAFYAPELRSGMTREQVAARLPAVLARLNPDGQRRTTAPRAPTPRAWIDQIEIALGPRASASRRRAAASRAVAIAQDNGWNDNRLAFSLFALGRLSLGQDSSTALVAFLQAGAIYGADPQTKVHEAHIAMQLAAFALSSGESEIAIEIVEAHVPAVARAQNAALLATLLMVKAEALDLAGRKAEAAIVRDDSLGWARYGFGADADVRRRAGEIAALNPANRRS